jgi:hypothetical protein
MIRMINVVGIGSMRRPSRESELQDHELHLDVEVGGISLAHRASIVPLPAITQGRKMEQEYE